jgi:hypothetical protein
MLQRLAVGVFFLVPSLPAQNNWFRPAILKERPVAKALESVDARSVGIVEEWIHLVEIPASSRKEQARAEYIRAAMEKLRLSDIRVDD